MNLRSIKILLPEELVMETGLKIIKEQCTSANHGDGVEVNSRIRIELDCIKSQRLSNI